MKDECDLVYVIYFGKIMPPATLDSKRGMGRRDIDTRKDG